MIDERCMHLPAQQLAKAAAWRCCPAVWYVHESHFGRETPGLQLLADSTKVLASEASSFPYSCLPKFSNPLKTCPEAFMALYLALPLYVACPRFLEDQTDFRLASLHLYYPCDCTLLLTRGRRMLLQASLAWDSVMHTKERPSLGAQNCLLSTLHTEQYKAQNCLNPLATTSQLCQIAPLS